MKRILIVIWLVWVWKSYGQNEISLISSGTNNYNHFFTEVNHELWVASTLVGFNRYTGIDTKHYLLNDSISGLKGSVIQSSMYADRNGLLWTSTFEKLCYYSPQKDNFSSFTLKIDGTEIQEAYHVFHIDSLRQLIYLRAGGYLLTYDVLARKIHQIFGKTNSNWFTVIKDTIFGAPWMYKPGFEIWTKQGSTWKNQEVDLKRCGIPDAVRIIQVFKYEQTIWLVTTTEGVIQYDEYKACKTYLYNQKKLVCSAAVRHDDKILISTLKYGLVVFDMSKERYQSHTNVEGNQIDYTFVSTTSNVWMTNGNKGVFHFPILHITDDRKNDNNEKWWSYISQNNDHLILINNTAINISKGTKNTTMCLGCKKVPLRYVEFIETIGNNEILFCGFYDCYRYNMIDQRFVKQQFNEGRQISSIKYVQDTLFYIADSKLYYTLLSDPKAKGQLVNKEKMGGFQLIETYSRELKAFVVNSSFLYIKTEKKDTLIDVHSYINHAIYDEKNKVHYLGTSSGLFKIDNHYSVVKISEPSIFPVSKSINHLEQDLDYVYFSEGNRLARVHKKSQQLRYFTKNKYTTAPLFVVRDDSIFIAQNYVEKYAIIDAFAPLGHFSIIMDECIINKKDFLSKFNLKKCVSLEHNQNQIQVKFYINDWENAAYCNLRYKLTPLSTDWTTIANGAAITTPFLSQGKYKLEIQGLLADSSSIKGQSYEFEILPPWYGTWWFKMMIIAVVGAILYALYLIRLRQVKEKYRIKSELIKLERSALQAQMNPHFIFNCLNSIQNYIMRNDKALAMDYLGGFAKLIRQYLNASSTDLVTLEEEISMLENYLRLEQMRFNSAFDYHFQIDPKLEIADIKLPPLLLQPFVENAVLHGMSSIESGGLITITIDQSGHILQVMIKDNGKGIAENKPTGTRRSLGTSITQKRLQYINDHADANYSINTQSSEKGTIVQVTINIT